MYVIVQISLKRFLIKKGGLSEMATKEQWDNMIVRLQKFIDEEEFMQDIPLTDEEYDFLISCLSEISDVISSMSWDNLQDYLEED